MNIRKMNEFFDDDDLKSRFEIPYLTGELEDEIKDWKTITTPINEEDTDSFYRKVLYRFEILNNFHEDSGYLKTLNGDDVKIYSRYATSLSPAIDGGVYYTQLSLSFEPIEKLYYINAFLKINGDADEKNWKRYDLIYPKLDKIYKFIDFFLDFCVELNVIKSEQKISLGDN